METGSLILGVVLGFLFGGVFAQWAIHRKYWLLPKDRVRYDR
jgi:Na+/glutamate symporter